MLVYEDPLSLYEEKKTHAMFSVACNGFSFALFLALQIYMSNWPKIAEKT